MKETLADIRKKLQEKAYKNEEHVRLSLVSRLLEKLGWNIWDTCQVNAEFVPTPTEDNKKVDLALFLKQEAPAVFFEMKAAGSIFDLAQVEQQLRNYNRDITAQFCVITDGRTWRFYYSQAAGEFAKKCFKTVDMVSDNLDDLERTLQAFLGKQSIEDGSAVEQAQALLKLNQKQRAMEECLPEARRRVQETPFPSLPTALAELLKERGYPVSPEEAKDFVTSFRAPIEIITKPPPQRTSSSQTIVGPSTLTFPPERPPNLHHTKVLDGRIGELVDNDWNGLLRNAVLLVLKSGVRLQELRGKGVTAQVREGLQTLNGFHAIRGSQPQVSVQGVDANKAWENVFALAKCARVPVHVRFVWREKERAQEPGKEGILEWRP